MEIKVTNVIFLLAIISACHTATDESPVRLLSKELLNESDSYKSTVKLDVPARVMWGWEPNVSGFCGSMTVQSLALFYGNWISEGLVRASVGNEEILLEKNIERAMDILKLKYESWGYATEKQPQHEAYWSWCKKAFMAGIPVVGTVFVQSWAGDLDYDHIIPFIGFSSNSGSKYDGEDIIYYHDLYKKYTMQTKMSDFVKNRKECTAEDSKDLEWCMMKNINYGSKILGFEGMEETLPAKLDVGHNSEPDWSGEDKQHGKPILFQGTLTISGLKKGDNFTVYRFSGKANPGLKTIDVSNLPSSGFATAGTHDFAYKLTATEETVKFTDPNMFMSNTAQFYRVVKDKKIEDAIVGLDA